MQVAQEVERCGRREEACYARETDLDLRERAILERESQLLVGSHAPRLMWGAVGVTPDSQTRSVSRARRATASF
jgi:hypothetical protein